MSGKNNGLRNMDSLPEFNKKGENMKPIYAENLVVAIKNRGDIEWYVLEKDYCYLDYSKLEEVYQKKGYNFLIDNELRFGIKIVSEKTKSQFIDAIKKYKLNTEELKQMLIGESDSNARLAYNPSVLIDFDSKKLLSYYAEPESFEDFVPNGWKGIYKDFKTEIPQSKRYWEDDKK